MAAKIELQLDWTVAYLGLALFGDDTTTDVCRKPGRVNDIKTLAALKQDVET